MKLLKGFKTLKFCQFVFQTYVILMIMFSNKHQQDDGLPLAENLASILVKMSFKRMKIIQEKLLFHLFYSFSKFEHYLLFFSEKNFTIKVEHFSKKYYHLIRFLQQIANLSPLPNLTKIGFL